MFLPITTGASASYHHHYDGTLSRGGASPFAYVYHHGGAPPAAHRGETAAPVHHHDGAPPFGGHHAVPGPAAHHGEAAARVHHHGGAPPFGGHHVPDPAAHRSEAAARVYHHGEAAARVYHHGGAPPFGGRYAVPDPAAHRGEAAARVQHHGDEAPPFGGHHVPDPAARRGEAAAPIHPYGETHRSRRNRRVPARLESSPSNPPRSSPPLRGGAHQGENRAPQPPISSVSVPSSSSSSVAAPFHDVHVRHTGPAATTPAFLPQANVVGVEPFGVHASPAVSSVAGPAATFPEFLHQANGASGEHAYYQTPSPALSSMAGPAATFPEFLHQANGSRPIHYNWSSSASEAEDEVKNDDDDDDYGDDYDGFDDGVENENVDRRAYSSTTTTAPPTENSRATTQGNLQDEASNFSAEEMHNDFASRANIANQPRRTVQDDDRNGNLNENRYGNGVDPIAASTAGYTPGTAANVSSRGSSSSSSASNNGSHHHGLPNMQHHTPTAVGGNVAPSGSASVGIRRAPQGRQDMSRSVPRRSNRSTRSVNYN